MFGDVDGWLSMWLGMFGIFVGLLVFIGTCVYVADHTRFGGWGAMALASVPFVLLWAIGKRDRAHSRERRN
jgi:hypothetical protein